METPRVKRYIIRRRIETCPVCGAWNPFRKGKGGGAYLTRREGLKRMYGECRACGAKLTLVFDSPPGGGDGGKGKI